MYYNTLRANPTLVTTEGEADEMIGMVAGGGAGMACMDDWKKYAQDTSQARRITMYSASFAVKFDESTSWMNPQIELKAATGPI